MSAACAAHTCPEPNAAIPCDFIFILRCFQGHNFACLPRLRQLCIEAKGDSRTDNEEIPVAVAELPPGLEILEVTVTFANLAYSRQNVIAHASRHIK